MGQMITRIPDFFSHRNNPGSATAVPLLLMLITVLFSSAANAENWDRYHGWEVTAFELTGVPEDTPSDFQSQLALHGQRKLLGIKRPPFNTKLLAEDLARIRLHMARIGYPQAKVFPTVEPRNESRQLALSIAVEAGPAVKLGEIELVGWPSRVAFPDTSKNGVIFEGQIFRDDDIAGVRKTLRSRLLNSGFESAKVHAEVGFITDGFVDLLLAVDAGPYCLIDSLVIDGCSDDLKPVALRVMNWKSGNEYSSDAMRRMALDLRNTQLFGHVELKTENLQPGSLLLKTQLENARMRTWTAGIGTWSDNPWMVQLGWSHNNLFKHGIGFYTNGLMSEYEQSVGASVFWLGWLTPGSRTSFGVMAERQSEEAFRSNEEKVELIQSFRPNLKDIWKVGISISMVDVETFTPDPHEAPDAQGQMLELWSDWKWDRTDDPLSPSTGHYIKVSATVSPPWGLSESPYWQLQFDGVRFQSISEKIVVAGRMRAGASQTLGDATDLLPNRRFYVGGYNTMRGYKRRQLGPEDSTGDPRGGQFVALAGVEARFPLVWLLAGAVFVDSGQVWREYRDVDSGTISGAAGLALDLITPLGPLRLSYAANFVNRQENEPRNMWLFGIGYPW